MHTLAALILCPYTQNLTAVQHRCRYALPRNQLFGFYNKSFQISLSQGSNKCIYSNMKYLHPPFYLLWSSSNWRATFNGAVLENVDPFSDIYPSSPPFFPSIWSSLPCCSIIGDGICSLVMNYLVSLTALVRKFVMDKILCKQSNFLRCLPFFLKMILPTILPTTYLRSSFRFTHCRCREALATL